MSFRLVPKSVTLNNLERHNGRYFALFQRILHQGALRKSSRSLSHLLMSSCLFVFVPNDAMLARCMLWSYLCPSDCLSVTSRCSTKMVGCITRQPTLHSSLFDIKIFHFNTEPRPSSKVCSVTVRGKKSGEWRFHNRHQHHQRTCAICAVQKAQTERDRDMNIGTLQKFIKTF